MNNSYKAAGVDVEAGYQSVELMKEHVKKTFTAGVISDIGGFGGLFDFKKLVDYENPVLVSGTDGVGTKLKLAFLMDKHDTVGQDCVAMCVNDIICSGAKPLFFLDYVAVGKNKPEKVAQIVKGVADGCVLSECALIGGETAEMPGFYPVDEYDLAGFAVGIVDRDKVIDCSKVADGDALVGIASSGPHSNGYSLIRKVFKINEDHDKSKLDNYIESIGSTLGEALIKPTKIYVKTVLDVISKFDVHGISHITGGGFYENIPRMLNKKGARIQKGTWPVPPIFDLIQSFGQVDQRDMYNTFNMGIGMVLAVPQEDKEAVVNTIKAMGEEAYVIGYVDEKADGVVL